MNEVMIQDLKKFEQVFGEDLLVAFCQCFVHADRLLSLASWPLASGEKFGEESVAYSRDLNTMFFLALGALHESVTAVDNLEKAGIGQRFPDSPSWPKLNELAMTWKDFPRSAELRSTLGFHVDSNTKLMRRGLKRLVEDRWEIHGDVLLRWTQVVPAASNVAGDPMGSFVNVREAKKAGRTVKSRNRHTEPVLYYSLNRQVTDKVSGRETLEHWGILRYNAAHANGGIATVDFEGPKGDVKLDKEPLREAFPTAFKVTMDLFTTADFTGFFQSVCDDELAIQFSDGARYFIPKGAANRVAAAIEAIADATGWNTGIMVNPVMDTPVQRAQQAHNLMEEYGRVLARVREWKDKLIGDDSTQERSRLKNIELMKRDLQMLDLYESMLGTQFAEVQKVRQTGEASLRDEIKNMLDLTELMQSIKGR